MKHASQDQQILVRLGHALATKGAIETARGLASDQGRLHEHDHQSVQNMAERYCREYELDRDWILHGANDRKLAQLTPVFAMQSVSRTSGRWRFEEIERIALAPTILGPSRFVTRMESRALEPQIREGAYVVVDTEQNQVPIDSDGPMPPFAVDIHGEGLVIRMARMRENDLVELRSLDTNQPAIVVPLTASESRIVGRVVWVAQNL